MQQDNPNQTDESSGICRYQDMLVVDPTNAVFPNRCVITNSVYEGPKFRYREKISAQKAREMSQYAASAASGFSKGVIAAGAPVLALPVVALAPVAILASMKTVILEIGLSASEQEKFRKRKKLALYLIFGGLLTTFVYPITYLSLFGEPRGLTFASVLMFACYLGGFVTLMGGLIYYVIAVRQPITIKMFDGTYAWFSGVNEEFLSQLPELKLEDSARSEEQADKA